MEQAIFYILMFCIGTLFGSFFTLTVHRIPLHQDITHKRSYCPNCNHKLGFWDMIPVLSYIFLGGKCRYCKKRIRARYICLEILTGIVFLLFAMSLNIDFSNINYSKIVYLVFGILYFAGIIIIAGIDKEKKYLQKSLLIYEVIISCGYMIYLYTVEDANIYRYVIYLLMLAFVLVLDNSALKKKSNDSYIFGVLELCIIMSVFEYEMMFVYTAALTLLTIGIRNIIIKFTNNKTKNKQQENTKLPIASYLCYCNIIVTIVVNYLACRGGN